MRKVVAGVPATGAQSLWVWPLPPSGAVTFICEWPAVRIPVTRNTIDSHQILAAASRANVLFPPDQLPLAPWPPNREPQVPNQPFVF